MREKKKLLSGLIICMALAGGMTISQRVQAAENDFIIQDEVLSRDSISDSVIQNEVTNIENDSMIKDEVFPQNNVDDSIIPDRATSNDSDFVIEDGVLMKYIGNSGDVAIPDGVKKIDSFAFSGCASLKKVRISNNVTEVGFGAFSRCMSLTDISIPNSVTKIGDSAFSDCTSLINVTIPGSVASIGQDTFFDCTSLESVIISDGVTRIYGRAFSGCAGLTNVIIPSSVTFFDKNAFEGTPWIENRKQERNDHLVIGCNILIDGENASGNVAIPDGVTLIGNGAFSGCANLTSIKIPDSVTAIGHGAFAGCSNLASAILPNSIKDISWMAFMNCTCLTSVTIPDKVTNIGSNAFDGCANLTDVTILSNAPKIGNSTFSGTPWMENKRQENPDQPLVINNILFKGQMENGNFVIPNGVTSICADAFDWTEKEKVTSITMPESVASIGIGAFAGCENLKELTVLNRNVELMYLDNSNFCDILNFQDGWTEFKNPVVTIKGYKNSTAQELVDFLNEHWVGYNNNTTFQFVTLGETGGNTPRPSITPKPTKPKTPNKGTVLKSKNITYTVTKKGSEVVFTKISSMAASVNIPNTVKIGGINYKVTSISPNAFKGNKKLSKVTIGANITSIGKNTFSGCRNLKTITIKSTKLKSIGQNAFKGIKSTAKIKVPLKQLKAYKKLLKSKGQGKKVRITK